MSGYRQMQTVCKDGDWLCEAMVKYCQSIPDPCSTWNVDQEWHPENPTSWLDGGSRPAPIHAAPIPSGTDATYP